MPFSLTPLLPKSILRFLRDRRGVAAVEFAFVAPILICAYLGMAEVDLGVLASRQTSHLAATIGDLASQSDNLTAANLTDLWSIGGSMLQPFPTGTALKIRLSEVLMNSSGQAIVQWSKNQNWTGTAYVNGVTPIPQITTTQLSTGQYLIMTEVEYDYSSPIGNFLPGITTMTYTFYHHPRNGTQVTQTG
jgi:Flp pilus assembly protein TadG